MTAGTLWETLQMDRRLRLDTEGTLKTLAEEPGFVGTYREWEYDQDHAVVEPWIRYGPWNRFGFPGGIPTAPAEQLRRIYDLHLTAVSQFAREPDKVLYEEFLRAYVNILR